MNKQTIITILLALVAMSADSQRLNKDVERIQYVYALVESFLFIVYSSLVIHISFSNRSLIVLQLTSNSVPLYPSLSFALSPIVVPLLSDCCSIVVRLLSDCCPINERTTDVHQTHFNRTRVGAEPWVNRGQGLPELGFDATKFGIFSEINKRMIRKMIYLLDFKRAYMWLAISKLRFIQFAASFEFIGFSLLSRDKIR